MVRALASRVAGKDDDEARQLTTARSFSGARCRARPTESAS